MTADVDLLHGMDEWGPEKIVCVSDGKGGTRMSSTLTIAEVSRLARTMTWKWAAVDLFYGGAKAGILADPRSPRKEKVLRSFARCLSNEIPREYVLGLDVGLTETDAAIFADELGTRSASVGLPRDLGGLPYDQLGVTGYGVAEAIDAACEFRGRPVRGQRVAIQGFGAVGSAAARRLSELGATVVAVSTAEGAVTDVDGLDVDRLLELRDVHGDELVHHHDQPVAPLGTELRVGADIVVPAALQDSIDTDVITTTSAWLIVEGANLAITPDARERAVGRDIVLVPDFIANAGGVVAAAFSMVDRHSPFRTNAESVFRLVSEKMRSNTLNVLEAARSKALSTRDAALDLAQERVRAAMSLRCPVQTDSWWL
jgi:glutamate dehydrogenase (NAD(P)+)